MGKDKKATDPQQRHHLEEMFFACSDISGGCGGIVGYCRKFCDHVTCILYIIYIYIYKLSPVFAQRQPLACSLGARHDPQNEEVGRHHLGQHLEHSKQSRHLAFKVPKRLLALSSMLMMSAKHGYGKL